MRPARPVRAGASTPAAAARSASSGTVPTASAALLSLVLGFVVQRLLLGDVDPRSYSAAVAGLFEGATG